MIILLLAPVIYRLFPFVCVDCEMNIHKGCVKVIEESCIGALHRKDRGNDRISKIVDRFRPERELKRKLTTQGITRNQTFISRDHDGNHFILIFVFLVRVTQ